MQERRLHRRRRRRRGQPELAAPTRATFEGADFEYLSANVKYDDGRADDGQSIFPAYKIKQVDGIKVGFIGMTLKDTPNDRHRIRRRGPESSPDEVQTVERS